MNLLYLFFSLVFTCNIIALDVYKSFNPNEPIPLSISLGPLIIPNDHQDALSFLTQKAWGLDFNYHLEQRVCAGFGLGGFTRIITEDTVPYAYQISYISARATWFYSYSKSNWNPYVGARLINYIITQDRAANGLSKTNVAINPELGVLIPIYEHSSLEISLTYQFFSFPELFHQPEDRRQQSVHDNQWVVGVKWYF